MYLHLIIFAYNTSAHFFTGFTPLFPTFGKDARFTSDKIFGAFLFDFHAIAHNSKTSAKPGLFASGAHLGQRDRIIICTNVRYVRARSITSQIYLLER